MYILLIYSDGMQINITLGHINEVDRVAFNFWESIISTFLQGCPLSSRCPAESEA